MFCVSGCLTLFSLAQNNFLPVNTHSLIALNTTVVAASSLSSCLQIAILYARKRSQWLIIGRDKSLTLIKQEIQSEKKHLDTDVKFASVDSRADILLALASRNDRRLALCLAEHPEMQKIMEDDWFKARWQKGRPIDISRWCEIYLQRTPTELIKKEYQYDLIAKIDSQGMMNWRIKRFGDVAGALILLAMSLPILVVSAVLIKLTDGGPVLYTQTRTGVYRQPFILYKLRTMNIGAEVKGATWACRKDKRITKIGTLLRKLRFDELPQLWNVLKGDMSLIGPRPERPEFDELLEVQIPNYRLRYLIRPGLSGWAQVCYPYGASVEDSRKKLSYDIYYIRNFSMPLDILILIKTIQLIIRGEGSQPQARI